jgi:hypothetical protein
MNLPDEMPVGCNFYSVAHQVGGGGKNLLDAFVRAGWCVETSQEGTHLTIEWARLTANTAEQFVLSGWIEDIDTHCGEVLSALNQSGLKIESQWIGSNGRLWRELPFEDRMLQPDDPRLPDHIKAEIRGLPDHVRAELCGNAKQSISGAQPWWKFW